MLTKVKFLRDNETDFSVAPNCIKVKLQEFTPRRRVSVAREARLRPQLVLLRLDQRCLSRACVILGRGKKKH